MCTEALTNLLNTTRCLTGYKPGVNYCIMCNHFLEINSAVMCCPATVSMSPMLMIRSLEYFEQLEDLATPTTPQNLIKPMGLWDPRADDDRLIVTCIRLVGSELLVGFQGGHCLLFKPNNQSATCTVKVCLSYIAAPTSHTPYRQCKLL